MTTPTTPSTQPLNGSLSASAKIQGRIMWHELLATDVDGAQRFYTSVFGWSTQSFPMGEFEYTMWTVDGVPRGGFMPMPQEAKAAGAPQNWLTYFGADDVDASAAAVARAGGTIAVAPQDIPDVGRFAVVTDPQGAYFALYRSNRDDPETPGMVPVGDASWHELTTSDANAAYEFYSGLFHWESAGEFDMGGGNMYRMFGRNGLHLGGIMKTPPEMEGVPPNWLPYFRVSDIGATNERIRANGGTILVESMEVPGGDLITIAQDPQGGAFATHQTRS